MSQNFSEFSTYIVYLIKFLPVNPLKCPHYKAGMTGRTLQTRISEFRHVDEQCYPIVLRTYECKSKEAARRLERKCLTLLTLEKWTKMLGNERFEIPYEVDLGQLKKFKYAEQTQYI